MAGDLGYPFRQARWYEEGRGGYDAVWIVWHATDDEERDTYAEGLGNYFATTSRRVSTHFGVDFDSVMQYVKLADTAFGAGAPANYRGIHIEHSGEANQTREQWLDPFGQGLLRQSAELNARLHRLTGIPFRGRFLTDDELRKRVPGTTRHMDLVRVFGGTHDRCPSPNFPSDELFRLIAERLNPTPEDDDMNLSDSVDMGNWNATVGQLLAQEWVDRRAIRSLLADNNKKLDVLIGLLTPKEPS